MRSSLLTALMLIMAAAQSTPAPSARVPVVVELFTSEGCSSCPPADALLSKLAQEQPVPGVEIIPLGMHVTYWDQLGWKDAASLPLATTRQQDYAVVFGTDRIYTPQAVIDGQDEVVGSDEAALRRAIARAAKRPHLNMDLTASVERDGIHADVSFGALPADQHDEGPREPMRTVIIITEDDVTSVVKRGENGGRTLHHAAVVRRVVEGGKLGQLAPEWNRSHLRLTALAQGKQTRHIYAAATVPLK